MLLRSAIDGYLISCTAALGPSRHFDFLSALRLGGEILQFLEFPHSHYCEAARWALDVNGALYQRKTPLPLLHKFTVQRIAASSSLPVLIDGDRVIQGSHEIIDYCDLRFAGPRLTPGDATAARTIAEIEQRADRNIGVPLRAIIYDRLLDNRPAVQHCFMQNSPNYQQWVFRGMYPVMKRVIRKVYIPSKDYVVAAKEKFDDEIGRLDDQVAGREFIVGDALTRADIMLAAMLSLIVLPKEHACDWPEIVDPVLRDFFDAYRDRPTLVWVRQLYARHRNAMPVAA